MAQLERAPELLRVRRRHLCDPLAVPGADLEVDLLAGCVRGAHAKELRQHILQLRVIYMLAIDLSDYSAHLRQPHLPALTDGVVDVLPDGPVDRQLAGGLTGRPVCAAALRVWRRVTAA